MKQLPCLASRLQPVFARSSITKARNRTTTCAPESIPALLFSQNERTRTKSGRQTGKLFRARSLHNILENLYAY